METNHHGRDKSFANDLNRARLLGKSGGEERREEGGCGEP